jgi:hypothetical protein
MVSKLYHRTRIVRADLSYNFFTIPADSEISVLLLPEQRIGNPLGRISCPAAAFRVTAHNSHQEFPEWSFLPLQVHPGM